MLSSVIVSWLEITTTNLLRQIPVPVAATAVALIASVASSQTCSNPWNITVRDLTVATLYSSEVNVSGGPTNINTKPVTQTTFSTRFQVLLRS